MPSCDYEIKSLEKSMFAQNRRKFYESIIYRCFQPATTVWTADPKAGPSMTYYLDPDVEHPRCEEHPIRDEGWLCKEAVRR